MKKNWVLIFAAFAGLVLGGFIGEFFGSNPMFSWLNYGKEFGISPNSPMVVNFYIIRLTFGVMIKINIASILGVMIALLGYKLIKR